MNHMSTQITGRSLLLVLAIILMAGWMSPAASQGAPGEECWLEPLTLPLWDATPPAVVAATPAAAAPDGEYADDDIGAAVEGLVACINTGEPRLVHAVFTARYLAELYADPKQAFLPAFEQSLDQNLVEAIDEFTLEAVDGIQWLDDGRVSVNVTMSNGLTTFRDTLILAWQDGFWLIDGVTELDPPQ